MTDALEKPAVGAPQTGVVIAWLASFVAALATLLLAAMPWQMPATGLDPSWRSALEYAYLHNLVLGRDFSFTAGPLSFIHTRIFHPETFPWVAAACIHAAAVYAAVVHWSAHRALALAPLALLALCLAPINLDALYLSLPLAIALLSIVRAAPAWLIAVLIAGLAFSSLAKFSVLLLSLPLLVLADISALTGRRRRYWHTALYCVAIVVFYRASGQPLSALLDFLTGSFDVAAGYGQTMANFTWTSHQTVLALVCIGLPVALLLSRGWSGVSLFCVAAFAGYTFFAFKLGNVRDGHQGITWHTLAAAGALFVLLPGGHRPRLSAVVAGAWILLCAISLQLFVFGFQPAAIVKERGAQLTALASGVAAWRAPAANFSRLTQQRRASEAVLASRVPSDLAGTVGSMPWEFSELLAAGLHFVPSPPLQAYSNYTPRLRVADVATFRRQRAPGTPVLSAHRHGWALSHGRVGLSLIPILAGYDVIFRRRAGCPEHRCSCAAARIGARSTCGRSRAGPQRLGDWVGAPVPVHGGLMLAIRLEETLAGKMLTLATSRSTVEIDFRFASGAVVTSRAFPNLLSDGFLVMPPEMTDAQLIVAAESGLETARPTRWQPCACVKRVSARSASRGSIRSQRTPSRSQARPSIRCHRSRAPANPMQALIEGRVLELPEVRLVDGRLLAHPPAGS